MAQGIVEHARPHVTIVVDTQSSNCYLPKGLFPPQRLVPGIVADGWRVQRRLSHSMFVTTGGRIGMG
ncbi:MAG TPA: hypothetical protein VF389_02145 [Woeseiaceae bacterium]